MPARYSERITPLVGLARNREKAHRMSRTTDDPLYRLAHRLTGSVSDAWDLYQDTWLRCAEHAEAYEERGQRMAWMMRVMTNLHITQRRKATTERAALSAYRDAYYDVREPASPAPDVSDVAEAIERLPALFRDAMHLHYVVGMDQRQIADMLSAHPCTVRSRLHRGKQLLRQEMGL